MMRLTDDGKDGAALLTRAALPTRAASLNRMGLVRCLKGAASSILWALLLEGRPMTAGQLQEATGYSDKPVSQALARLRALGLVAHHGRYQGWSLSKRMRDGGFAPLSTGRRPVAEVRGRQLVTRRRGTGRERIGPRMRTRVRTRR